MAVWARLAAYILDHRRVLVGLIVVLTAGLGYHALQIETEHSSGHFISSESKAFQEFERAGEVFGRSQTFLYLVFPEADPYDTAFLSALDSLTTAFATYEGVEQVLSLTNVPVLVRSDAGFAARPLYDATIPPDSLRGRIAAQTFLRGLLLSNDGTTAAMLVKIDHVFNNTPARVDLVERIQADAASLPGKVALAGFPYLRTEYARRVSREAPLFTLLALVVAMGCLYLIFGAWRAVLLPTVIVGLGIVWTLGLMHLLDYRVNIVTSVLPALLVIIGMATVIHLVTKFLDQYARHGDQRAALVETVRTVGLATFLTCLTTAIGFGVLVLSGSRLLAEFGLAAALGILLLFFLAITLTPIVFRSYHTAPSRAAPWATHDRLARLFSRLAAYTRLRTGRLLAGALVLAAAGLAGTAQISTDIFVFSDFYEDDPLRRDLAVFEDHFGGVLPMDVVIEAKQPGRFRSLGALRRLERLQQQLEALPPVGRSLAAPDLAKLATQAYFGGHPRAYRLPSSYELPYLQRAFGAFSGGGNALTRNLPTLVDSTYTLARVYLGVADIGTTAMNALADTVLARAAALFPPEQFEVFATGTAIRATRSGENLVENLLISLGVALVIISGLMALLFRSLRLMLISLAPNLLPLVVVGGAMGFTGIALKPSTALIFSIAFGIAVDSTIHFLTKYRLHRDERMTKQQAIAATLRETGKAIFFTTLILMSGFLVFTLSGFGGTVSMGALTALTLGVAMVANLLLLPALLYRFGPAQHLSR